jgi:hypothetical protein
MGMKLDKIESIWYFIYVIYRFVLVFVLCSFCNYWIGFHQNDEYICIKMVLSCNIDDVVGFVVAFFGLQINSWALIFRNWITFLHCTWIDCWIIYNKLFNICLLIVMWCIAFKNAWISWNDGCSASFDLGYFTVLYFTLLYFFFFSLIFFVKTDLAIFIKILYCIYTY